MGFTYFTKNSDVLPTLLKTGDAYFVGLGTLLDNRPYVWVPIFAAAAMLALAIVAPKLHLPRDRRLFVMVGAGFVVASWLCFAVFHAAGQGVLSLFFYVDYFVPALVLVAIAIIGEVFRRVPKVWSDAATGVLVVGFVGLYSVQRWGSPANWTLDTPMFIFGVAAVIGMLFIVRMPRVSLVTTLVAFGIVPFAFVTTPISLSQYSDVVSGNTATAEHDTYRDAIDFQDGVLSGVPTDRSVGFWYGQQTDLGLQPDRRLGERHAPRRPEAPRPRPHLRLPRVVGQYEWSGRRGGTGLVQRRGRSAPRGATCRPPTRQQPCLCCIFTVNRSRLSRRHAAGVMLKVMLDRRSRSLRRGRLR
jgi:hypothetical protein